MISAPGILLMLSLAMNPPPAEVERARALEKQAYDAQRAGRYADAEKPLLEAIALWTKLNGPGDIEVLNDQMNLAVSYRRRGEAERAVPMLERVIDGFAKNEDLDAPELRRSALNNLAMAYRDLGKLAEAKATLESCLAMLEGAKVSDERARLLDNLAAVFTDSKDPVAAEKYARRSLADWRALRGDSDVDVAIALSNVGAAVMRQARFDAARPVLETSLRLLEKLLGQEHVEVAATLNLLAELEWRAGRAEVARGQWERSLGISRKRLKPGHPIAQDAMSGLEALEKRAR